MFSKKRKEVEDIRTPLKKQKKEDLLITKRVKKNNFCRICTIRSYIVGIRYHGGKSSVCNGSKIWLRRNPKNTFDPNAIECWPRPTSCTREEIVGHICKELALPLSRLLDSNLVCVEGKIVSDVEAVTGADYVIPILINLSGNIAKKEELICQLQRYQYYNILTHNKTAPMKIRLVDGQRKFMAYEIEEVESEENEELDLQQMELRHLLVLFALLMQENNQFCLESDNWEEKINCVNVDFELPEKTKDILRKRIHSKQLKNYIMVKEQKIAFKSTQVLRILIQFLSPKDSYVEYFVQHASNQGLLEYCVTSSQFVSRPAFVLNGDQLRKLIKRMKYGILSHPVIKDKSIHKTISETLKIPKVILSWDENGRRSFLKSLQKGTEDIFHARWMILGCAGVGKTTLLKKIRGLSMEEIVNTTPTEGVEIHNRIFEVTGNSLQDVTNKNISPVGVTAKQSVGKPVNEQAYPLGTCRPSSSKGKPKANATMLYSRDTKQISKTKSLKESNSNIKYAPSYAKEVGEISSSFEEKRPVSLSDSAEGNRDPLPELFPLLWNKINSAKRSTLDILDFAGQSDYYASHQVSLRPDAGYILVLNMAEKLDDISPATISRNMIYENWTNRDFVQNWLSSIHTFAPSAPVILVATHAEGKTSRDIQKFFVDVWNVPKVEKLKTHLEEDRQFWVTLRENENIAKLKDCIANQSKTLATWGRQIPRKWALCEKLLKDIKKTRKIVTFEALSSLIKKRLQNLQMSRDDLIWMLKFFHDIGEIIYFDEKDLEKIVILDVDFLLEVFKCIILTDIKCRGKIARRFGKTCTVYNQRGLLGDEMCIEMLKDILDLNKKDKEAFFQYLTHIGIMINVTEPNKAEKLWYIPSMNKSLFPHKEFKSYEKSPVHCFVADFLPDLVYHRLISKAITNHFLGEILLDGDQKCIYQTVCAFLHDETYIVLIGRCETSVQVQILAKIKLDKSVCRTILAKVSNIIREVANTFHLNIEFSEGLLCDQSQITDHFRTSGMLRKDIQRVCKKKSTFLCKTCPISKRHLINSTEWLSFWIAAADSEEEDLIMEKRDIYRLFDYVATKINTTFEARSLCLQLLGDGFVFETGGKYLQRALFDVIVKWMELNPNIEHIGTLTVALENIDRSDIAEEINCNQHTDHTMHHISLPDLDINQSDIEIVVQNAAVKYHKIGLYLGLSPQVIQQIECDNPRDVRRKIYCVLTNRCVHRQMLINSLNYVGRRDLIVKLTHLWDKSLSNNYC